jgi:hypothetical protein
MEYSNNIGLNLMKVYNELLKTNKKTKIAHLMGYMTTRQLYNTIDNKTLLSTKAIIKMVANLQINPTFLFTGTGDMFLFKTDKPVSRVQYTNISTTL